MKYIFFTFALFISSISFSQSLKDTKDFIIEQIDANDPLSNYDNAAFFQNILKSDAERLAGKSLSDDEYENIFIYAHDVYFRERINWQWSFAQTIDIRDITKVSTTKKTSNNNVYYSILVYIGKNYYAKEYSHTKDNDPEWNYIDKMEIIISENYDAAQKIKKAIMHLGQLYNINVKDGDLF